MAKPEKDFTATFDALVASLGLKEGEEAYNKCRARFFMDAMKLVNDKVASGDPTAKSLEADYATLVETRGSQNRIPKKEKTNSNVQSQATEDLESKFQVLAKAAGTLPGEPGYKRLLRKFLTAEYATNAEQYYSNARNVRDKNRMFKFEALALICGVEYDSPRYNKLYNDFFQKTGVLLSSAMESTNGHEEASSTKIMAQETNHSPTAAESAQQSDDESPTMKSLRNKLAAARLDVAVPESVSQMPEDDDSQYALQFKGRHHAANGKNLRDDEPSDGAATSSQRSNRKQPKRDQNHAQNDGAENAGAQKDGAKRGTAHKDGAQNKGPQKGGSPKDRAKKAKEDFNAYFGDPGKLENWQRLCRDLDIDPVPTSITKCKKETKKIYVNIYQFLDQTKTGFRATRFPNQAALADYCNNGKKRKFPRNIAKRTGALAGLLHYVN
ncbi:hypothetical protein VE03_03915 [Pseudogymnoascus sp. 23342-1-I1]|nr:hypothetical protein VE03_03915 [Pseudogymnoascus sp. 23342-1-I1]